MWKAYTDHLVMCIDLRLFSREGMVAHTIFRSGVREGRWRGEIMTSRSTKGEQNVHVHQYVVIRSIERLELPSGTKLTDNAHRNASDYKLLFRLSDGSVLEM